MSSTLTPIKDVGLMQIDIELKKKLKLVTYIIVADDDLDDQELIRDALLECGHAKEKIQFVNDGEELTAALSHAEKLPKLILLDLNMPRKNGKEALAEIRQNERLRHIPIVIFTTSDSLSDVRECYALGSNTYITKPHLYSELLGAMQSLTAYWFRHSQTADS